MKRLLSHRFMRFAGVGVLNTLLDFILLNALVGLTGTRGTQVIRLAIINAISVGTIACFSFYMNRKVVFRHSADETPGHRIIVFVAITLVGLFLVNEVLFTLALHHDHALARFAYDTFDFLNIPFFTEGFFRTNIAKVFATGGSLIWNYKLYKRFVFNTDRATDPQSADQ